MIWWHLSASLLILAVMMLRRIMGNWINARVRYGMWAVVLVRLMLPLYTKGPPAILRSVLPNKLAENWNGLLTSNEELRSLLMAVYLIGALITAAVLVFSNLKFTHHLKKNRTKVPIDGGSLAVYMSDCVESPCLVGVLCPCIYLTSQVYEDETLLRYSMLHEQTHYRHLDHIWSCLRCVCLCLHWFNPLVWMAAHLSKIDGELACDETVVRKIGCENKFDYGRALIAVTCALAHRFPLGATTLIGGECLVKRRVQRIVAEDHTAVDEMVFTGAMMFMIVLWTCT